MFPDVSPLTRKNNCFWIGKFLRFRALFEIVSWCHHPWKGRLTFHGKHNIIKLISRWNWNEGIPKNDSVRANYSRVLAHEGQACHLCIKYLDWYFFSFFQEINNKWSAKMFFPATIFCGHDGEKLSRNSAQSTPISKCQLLQSKQFFGKGHHTL